MVVDDLYELHVDRIVESDTFKGAFYTCLNLDSIQTAEVYSPIVDKFGSIRWVFRGRNVDMVKLSWLAKFHATHIGAALIQHD
ncbi:NRPS-like enzyme [Penicillium argentinense]|uniref:NRPS-like enzyme n=1 Tax=Penicillium argentinense TaxID=1131581 RepID=A0A9W9KAD5_9EURO|nr:NRPS-like enzyme [Penicillium argentinense]KAJ5098895.1 NRPS-like enzyme [Penicillium argentinense]